MKKLKLIIAPLLSLIIVLGICSAAARELMPRRMDYGSTWDRYLLEDKNSIDILVFGSSIAYCDFVPAAVYEETGLTSYVMAGSEQTIPMSYYYIAEALKTQTPQKIILEISAMYFKEYQNYTKVNVGYMPDGLNRLAAIYTASEKELRTGLLFPLYNYHSLLWERWDSEEDEDVPEYTVDLLAGHTFIGKAKQVGFAARNTETEPENFEKNIKYLRKISRLCEKKGIELELCIFPACNSIPENDIAGLEEICDSLGYCGFVNYQTSLPEMDIDIETDYFDMLHFNSSGAWKFSKYIAGRLDELVPTAVHNEELWAERCSHFHSLAEENSLIID